MENVTVELKAFLERYYPISDADFDLFSKRVFLVEKAPKEKLIDEGEKEDHVYFVSKGIFRKYFRKGDEEIVTGFFREGDVCQSAVSYFTGLPSSFIIEAIEPTVCLGIRRHDLEFLIEVIPGLEKIFRAVLASLFVKKDLERMHQMKFSKKERFLQFCDDEPELLMRVPQKQLASYLEIAPETFCRMKQMRYKMAKNSRVQLQEN